MSGILISLYEAVHLNRNFMSTLTYCKIFNNYESHISGMLQTQSTVDNPCVKYPTDTQYSNLLVTFFQYW